MLRLLRVNVLLELHKYISNKFTYIFDVYKSTPSDINVEKWPFGIIAISLTVLFLLVLYLPVLSQDDPPQYHILDQGLLTEDIDQLLFCLMFLGVLAKILSERSLLFGRKAFPKSENLILLVFSMSKYFMNVSISGYV